MLAYLFGAMGKRRGDESRRTESTRRSRRPQARDRNPTRRTALARGVMTDEQEFREAFRAAVVAGREALDMLDAIVAEHRAWCAGQQARSPLL